jgi:cobalt-zinc-cadmium resistance protein CzcA
VKTVDGKPGWQSDGSYLTPEGERLTTELAKAAYLRTVQDWIIRPQMRAVRGVAGVDSNGGYVKQYLIEPNLNALASYGLSVTELADDGACKPLRRVQLCPPRRRALSAPMLA